jgi:glutathione peroxidase
VEQAPFEGFDLQSENGRWMDQFLREKYPDLYSDDGVKWNFSKFLIDRDGHVRGRFEPTIEPADIGQAIRELL